MSEQRKTLTTRSPSLPTNPSDAPTQNLDPSHWKYFQSGVFPHDKNAENQYIIDDFTTLSGACTGSVLQSRNAQLSLSNVENSVRAFSIVRNIFAQKKSWISYCYFAHNYSLL